MGGEQKNKEKERMGRPEQFITPHQLDSEHSLSHTVRVCQETRTPVGVEGFYDSSFLTLLQGQGQRVRISEGLLYSQHNYKTPLAPWCEHSKREWVHPLPFWSPTSGEIHHCPRQSSAVKQPSCHQLRRRRGGRSESPAHVQEAMVMMTASRMCVPMWRSPDSPL